MLRTTNSTRSTLCAPLLARSRSTSQSPHHHSLPISTLHVHPSSNPRTNTARLHHPCQPLGRPFSSAAPLSTSSHATNPTSQDSPAHANPSLSDPTESIRAHRRSTQQGIQSVQSGTTRTRAVELYMDGLTPGEVVAAINNDEDQKERPSLGDLECVLL